MEDTTGGSLPWPWQLASLTPGAGYHTFGTRPPDHRAWPPACAASS